MTRVCVVCEGQTEVRFIQTCITPHLIEFDVHAYPTILRSPSKPGKGRGGNVSIDRVSGFLSNQYNEGAQLTTFLDYYGFKHADGRSRHQLEADILTATAACTGGFDARRVRPYVQMHEFEAILFSDTEKFSCVQNGWTPAVAARLRNVRAAFDGPEDINGGATTAPSKRILAAFDNRHYNKVVHGPEIASAIGLAIIRDQCPQFDEWVTCMEGL